MAGDEDQEALRAAADDGVALCTIVGIDGSFSRRLGAQLAVLPDGSTLGSLADGCLEAELANQARQSGERRVLRYGQGSAFVDFRLPCGSGIDVLIDPQPDREAIRATVKDLHRRWPAHLDLGTTDPCLLRRRTFVPALRGIVLGNGPEARALSRLCTLHGMDAPCLSPDDGLSLGRVPDALEADAWTAIVLLFHDHEWEDALLQWAVGTQAFYIGAIGGAQARENRALRLHELGVSPIDIARVRSPIGLIESCRDVSTLAVSILAEMLQDYERLR